MRRSTIEFKLTRRIGIRTPNPTPPTRIVLLIPKRPIVMNPNTNNNTLRCTKERNPKVTNDNIVLGFDIEHDAMLDLKGGSAGRLDPFVVFESANVKCGIFGRGTGWDA